ncbi:hypothetical protein GAP32_439A [Cronobacter phage vB_CsaM_GAP32]|uniref:Uncharacterized protein n=1 Tax=Cronobacter phage vB_CsaM_GAP32 TaxID=1141136 RepID=K4FB83_9CAUD|nr:hypothetical protein GAP32_439A [Cronobacter phage vB_CsaM_GAP32]AFC21894.1 hypothetical protein GAP32_439A [Cronobacter phage vB_CsaM_GAP32]
MHLNGSGRKDQVHSILRAAVHCIHRISAIIIGFHPIERSSTLRGCSKFNKTI